MCDSTLNNINYNNLTTIITFSRNRIEVRELFSYICAKMTFPMKGLIDIYKIKNLNNGLGQFSHHLYINIIETKQKNFNVDFLVPNHPAIDLKLVPSVGYIRGSIRRRYFPILNQSYNFWHSVQQFPSFMPNNKTPLILTIHDLNFLIEKEPSKANKYLKRLQKNVDRANYITTISNFTKIEIEKHIDLKGKSIQVIYNGVDLSQPVDNKKPEYVTNSKFFFSIGEFKEKKNFHVLLPLMKYFDDHQLVIAGNHNSAYGRQIQEEIDKLELNNKVILAGKISESEKNWLYQNCRAFLFPSVAEGFGMPVIEAMSAGKPTFLNRQTSLPEIGSDKATYFASLDAANMADFIKAELKEFEVNQATLSAELITYSQKFSWTTCIEQYMELYNKVANEHS